VIFGGAIVKICGGCGGRPNLAQAGGREMAKLPEALDVVIAQLQEELG
jgi:alanyl-tRNA synthetase